MSYDIDLTINTGKGDVTVVEIGNHTSNTSQMWREAGCSLKELDGKVAQDVIEQLRKAVNNMADCPDKYKAMNPSNNWGSYETALKFLRDILIACESHPSYQISVSY